MFERLKWLLKPYVEKSVVLQSVSQHLMVRYGLLLPHDPDYHGMRQLSRHPNNLFLDVGANQGTSVLSFRCFHPQIPILSLEANELHRVALERLQRADSNFEFRIVACGSEFGQLAFYTPVKAGAVTSVKMHTMTSTDLSSLKEGIREHFGAAFAKEVSYRETTSDVVTLDSLGVRPSILKIDTEGAEYEVLKGGREMLREEQPFVLIEKNDSNYEECHALLSELDYEACGYDQKADRFTPGTTQTRNIYFLPRSLSDGLRFA